MGRLIGGAIAGVVSPTTVAPLESIQTYVMVGETVATALMIEVVAMAILEAMTAAEENEEIKSGEYEN